MTSTTAYIQLEWNHVAAMAHPEEYLRLKQLEFQEAWRYLEKQFAKAMAVVQDVDGTGRSW